MAPSDSYSAPATTALLPGLPTPDERLASWEAAFRDEPIRASLGFGRLVEDGEVQALLRKYEVVPSAIYANVAGMWGVRRPPAQTASIASISEARRVTASLMRNRVRSSRRLAGRTGSRFTADSLERDPKRLALARSVLAMAERDERAVSLLTGGDPFIYAVEVRGTVTNVRAIGADAMVKSFEPATRIETQVIVPRPALPTNLPSGPLRLLELENVSETEVHQRLVRLGDTAKREDR